LDACNSCGAVISAHTRAIHWDFHTNLTRTVSELNRRIEALERAADADRDAGREELERE
jgi:hypothetical protein